MGEKELTHVLFSSLHICHWQSSVGKCSILFISFQLAPLLLHSMTAFQHILTRITLQESTITSLTGKYSCKAAALPSWFCLLPVHDVLVWRLLPLATCYCQRKLNQHLGLRKRNAKTHKALQVTEATHPFFCLFTMRRGPLYLTAFSSLLKAPHTTMRVCFVFLLIFCNHFCHLKEICFKWTYGNLLFDILNCFKDLISIIQSSWERHGNRYLHRHAEIIRDCLGWREAANTQGRFSLFNLTYTFLGLHIILNNSRTKKALVISAITLQIGVLT